MINLDELVSCKAVLVFTLKLTRQYISFFKHFVQLQQQPTFHEFQFPNNPMWWYSSFICWHDIRKAMAGKIMWRDIVFILLLEVITYPSCIGIYLFHVDVYS